MKKATYFFFALCVALFCALPLSAQIYTETYHRCHLIPSTWSCGGGTYELTGQISNLKAYVRGVEQFNRSFTRTITNNPADGDFYLLYSGATGATCMPGNLAFDYKDCTGELVIEAVAGQEFTIEGVTDGHRGWLNAVLFVDWDGNGVFDDHDIDEYNLYGFSDWANEEHAGYGPDAEHPGLEPKWTVKVPADYPVEKTVRVRIRVDEGVGETFGLRDLALSYTTSIVGATNYACGQCLSVLRGENQYFYSMYMHRFTPTGQGYRATTVDVALKIKPNPYSDVSATGSQLITATGSVACTTNNINWTAIKTPDDFENFLENPSGNYYLANDITLTSAQPSCKEFSGTFDGNGHTITYSGGTVATRGVLSKDECFYPYALNYDDMRTQLQSFDRKQEGYASVDLTSYPEYDISGGFCGKLAHSGTIKNVKVVYSGAVTYNSSSGQQVLFGLVAGIAKGRVENVSVDIQQPVQVQMTASGRPSAVGGIAGILFGGIIKNCDVNVDALFALSDISGYAFDMSALGGFVGRLQSGVIGNVKFSGNVSGKLILHVNPASNKTMNYIGGIAGMTNTPKGVVNGYYNTTPDDKHLYWGYDNGSTGLDVNNVILAYNGSMEMTSAATGTDNFYCRGLLFGEACDTATVPNLITQYATRPTIELDCSNNQALSGTNIPLISKPFGSKYSDQTKRQTTSAYRIGKLYLYKDGRYSPIFVPATSMAFTNVTVADTKLDWAYEVQTLSNGSCVSFSTPYAVATNTTASAAGIENASANVSDLGGAVVKIDPQPATTPDPSWTWSSTATPTTPAVEPLVCTGGGGGGNRENRPASVSTPDFGTSTADDGRYTNTFSVTTSLGNVSSTLQTAQKQKVYFDKRDITIYVEQGENITINITVNGSWMMGSVFVDWNNDGNFTPSERVAYDATPDANFQTSYSFTIPSTQTLGTYTLRYITGWDHTDGSSNLGGDGKTVATNGGCVVDYELKVVKPYCKISGNVTRSSDYRWLTSLSFSGTQGASLASGTLQSNGNSPMYYNLRNKTLEVQCGETITTTPTIGSGSWMLGYVYVDWNNDGDFTDSGEYVAAPVSTTSNWWKPNDFTIPAGIAEGIYTMRYTSDWNCNNNVDRGADYPCGRTTNTVSDGTANYTANNGGIMVDFELKITGSSCTGGTCKYVHDFGEVGVDETATYTMPIGESFSITTALAGTSFFKATENGDNLELTYTPTDEGNHTDNLVITIISSGDTYDVELTGKGVNFPTLTFQIGEDGGGSISTDMGKTTQVKPIKFDGQERRPLYHGELLTAVPQGPCAIEGWYVSTNGGKSFTSQSLTTSDFTYTGTDNAIVEVRFKFEDFEGDFGNIRYTSFDNDRKPFYISTINTTGGIVNVDATAFTENEVNPTIDPDIALPHWKYLTDQRLQTLTHKLTCPDCPEHSDATACKNMSHTITVTVENVDSMPDNARLLCFIDYNYNGWFDFVSSPDGLASTINKNQIGKPLSDTNKELSELVYVGKKGEGTVNADGSITFTFTITNDNPVDITKYGKTRMRFMVATYVDMYGLGPVNQYGNYQPRFDTDGDGVADAYLPLNDSNGSLYSPNNECRYENYINVADVNFEVVAYIKAEDTYKIAAGTTTRMGDLYIESVEDDKGIGIHSGKIIFDKDNPTGSLQVEGNIIVRRRIYEGRWHDMSFPIAMQGLKGDGSVYDKGICAVKPNGTLIPLVPKDPDVSGDFGDCSLYTFDPSLRNQDNGYGNGPVTADAANGLTENTFYEFAADVTKLEGRGAAVTADANTPKYCWIQFHSQKEGFRITAKNATTVNIDYIGAAEANQYWNRNVFTIYNPYLSPINVKDITASVGWENITWWNASQNCFKPVSAAQALDMPPYFGYWIQFTEDNVTTGVKVTVTLGDPNRTGYTSADDGIVTVTPMSTTGAASSFDTPDAYTLGIDRAAATLGKYAVSNTIVTLTDVGSVDEFRAGYDMPVSYADATSTIPEIWSKAGSSRMMFNDVMRDNEVVVPVGIRIKEAGEYVIRLTDTNFAESLVQLYDKQTGARVDLQRNGELFSYNFLADAGDADSRFDLIIIAPESMTDLEVIEQDEVSTAAAIYKAGSTLRIVNMPLGYTVSVCDVIGREVLHTAVVDVDMQLELPNSQGVYLVNVRNEKGNSVQVLKLTR
ncbi:MAG: GEVED domain-containing protein [Paludibacteraceae bacterium]